MASRASSGKVLNQAAKHSPWLLGGSADLAPSTNTLLKFEDVGVTVDLISMDLSFISLTLILPVLRPFTHLATRILCLVKPQFEVGKDHVERGGLVTDPGKHQEVIRNIRSCAESLGYAVLGVIDSPILGAEGNKEFFLGLTVGDH